MSMSERELGRIEEWLDTCHDLLRGIDEARVKSEGRTTKATLYQSQQLDKYLRASTSKRMPALIDEVRRSHAEAADLERALHGISRLKPLDCFVCEEAIDMARDAVSEED